MKMLCLSFLVLFIVGCGGGKTPPKPKDEDDVGGASSQVESVTTIQIVTPDQRTEITVRGD